MVPRRTGMEKAVVGGSLRFPNTVSFSAAFRNLRSEPRNSLGDNRFWLLSLPEPGRRYRRSGSGRLKPTSPPRQRTTLRMIIGALGSSSLGGGKDLAKNV